MTLFSKKIPAQQQQMVQAELKKELEKANSEVISSIVSKDMEIIGEITFKGKARIDGQVEGNIKGEHLVLSETGRIKGDVEVGSLKCHGEIQGNVTARLVNALSTAVIDGRLIADDFSIESGAALFGEIQSRNRRPQKKTAKEKDAGRQNKSAPAKSSGKKESSSVGGGLATASLKK